MPSLLSSPFPPPLAFPSSLHISHLLPSISEGPGTTLTQRIKDVAARKSIHVRRSTAYEHTPSTGMLTPVPTPIPSSRVCVTPQMDGISSATTPLMMVADALSVVMANGDTAGSSGLNILASGAANRPKLPSSPLMAKINELGERGQRQIGELPCGTWVCVCTQ